MAQSDGDKDHVWSTWEVYLSLCITLKKTVNSNLDLFCFLYHHTFYLPFPIINRKETNMPAFHQQTSPLLWVLNPSTVFFVWLPQKCFWILVGITCDSSSDDLQKYKDETLRNEWHVKRRKRRSTHLDVNASSCIKQAINNSLWRSQQHEK